MNFNLYCTHLLVFFMKSLLLSQRLLNFQLENTNRRKDFAVYNIDTIRYF